MDRQGSPEANGAAMYWFAVSSFPREGFLEQTAKSCWHGLSQFQVQRVLSCLMYGSLFSEVLWLYVKRTAQCLHPVNPIFSPRVSPQCPLNFCPWSSARVGTSSSTLPSRKPCPPPTISPGSPSSGVGLLIQPQLKVPWALFCFYHWERNSRVEWLRCLQAWVLGFLSLDLWL